MPVWAHVRWIVGVLSVVVPFTFMPAFMPAVMPKFIPLHAPLYAMEGRIVAVVNDAVITSGDVQNRLRLLAYQMGNPVLSAVQQDQLFQQALAALVDEELQKQYADERGIGIREQDYQTAIQLIAQQNNLTPEQYFTNIQDVRGPADLKIGAEILWRKVIDAAVRPQVIVTTTEVDQLIRDMLGRQQDVTEQEIAQIFIPDATGQTQLAQLKTQITSGELTFAQAAQGYSAGPGATQGGRLGWFAPGELQESLAAAVQTLAVGEMSAPVQSPQGWHLLTVLNTRQVGGISLDPIAQVRLTTFSAESEAPLGTLSGRSSTPQQPLTSPNLPEITVKDAGWEPLSDLPVTVQNALKRLNPGETSRIIANPDGTYTVILLQARRMEIPEKLRLYRDRVRERLTENRVELAARRFLRELRERAFIDIRL